MFIFINRRCTINYVYTPKHVIQWFSSFETHRTKSFDAKRTVQRSETLLAPNNSHSSIIRLFRRGLTEVGFRDFPSEAE